MASASKKSGSAAPQSDSGRSAANGSSGQAVEVELAKCECCGLKEECTPAYIARVREKFYGRWICGLCAEAVKDELCRAERRIGMEDALKAHMAFCMQFNATNPAIHLAAAMRKLLKRSLDSPRGLRTAPSTPRLGEDVGRSSLARSSSCISTLAR